MLGRRQALALALLDVGLGRPIAKTRLADPKLRRDHLLALTRELHRATTELRRMRCRHTDSSQGGPNARTPSRSQAALAAQYGVTAFCYWHYWFGNGRRILERPFAEVLQSGRPDFPFCLGWANATWTGIWYGAPGRVLVEQTYPGEEDHRVHFESLLPAFMDPRYFRSTVGRCPTYSIPRLSPTRRAS